MLVRLAGNEYNTAIHEDGVAKYWKDRSPVISDDASKYSEPLPNYDPVQFYYRLPGDEVTQRSLTNGNEMFSCTHLASSSAA